jgi:hypothetical protein
MAKPRYQLPLSVRVDRLSLGKSHDAELFKLLREMAERIEATERIKVSDLVRVDNTVRFSMPGEITRKEIKALLKEENKK